MGTIYRNGTAFIGSGGAGGVELTQAEYDALPTTEKMNGSIYFISDGEASYPSASTMRYDNSTSGLTATSVQAAVDEVNEKVNDNAWDIAELNNGLTNLSYTSQGLTYTSGSGTFVAGGYCKIGNLVVVNFRFNATASNGVYINNFPRPKTGSTGNIIGGACYDSSNERAGFFYMNSNGSLVFPSKLGSGQFLVSFSYITE